MPTARTLVCLGDSITGHENLSAYLKWSHILQCMLDARLGEGEMQVVNKGIGGNTTADALARFATDVEALAPEIVVLLLGGNDVARRMDRQTTRANLARLLDMLTAAGTRVLVLQYHLLVNTEHPETSWAHLITNNDLLAAVAAEYGQPTLAMAPLFTQALAHRPLDELVHPTDGVHLKPGGEILYARAIYGKLVELGWV